MSSLVSSSTAFLLCISLVSLNACGGRAATFGPDAGISGAVGTPSPDSGSVPERDSGAGGAIGTPERDAGSGGVVVTPDPDAGVGGSIHETKPPAIACAQIRVPTAKEEPIHLRMVSTDERGVENGAWSVVGTCLQDSIRSSTCYSNVPVGGVGLATDFKVQVQTTESSEWIDLEIPLLIVRGGVPTPTSQVVWQGEDMDAWLTGYGEKAGSWCGANQPLPGSNWLSGTIDIGALKDDFKLPSNIVRFGPPVANGSATVGAKSVLDDARFLTMWNRAQAGSNDVDSDGIPDDHDNCLGRAAPNQSDANHDGWGDTCEPWCYVPTNDQHSALFDFDADGVDDTCDNYYTRFNPAQYADL